MMSRISPMNPLGYIINRQFNDGVDLKRKLFKERFARARNLFRKDLNAHYGCVNAIEFSTEGELLVSGGDDRRVLLWSLPEAIIKHKSPIPMQTEHISNVFCLAFDSINSKIFSGGNDDQLIVHDLKTGGMISKFMHKQPVYGLSLSPQSNDIIATAGEDGRILLVDIRESTNAERNCVAKHKGGFHSVMFNPLNSRLLATANAKEGIALWDCRKPKESLIHYDSKAKEVSGISVCFNSSGTHLLALRRRLPPVLFGIQNEDAICQFYHPHYFNSCTMKTCCFAGDNDEYVLSGSDDFNLYMWQVPKTDSIWGINHLALKGHRSIVNQVRYNKHNNLIASSGVEKMVKLWSTLPLGHWQGSLLKEHSEPPRSIYSHDDYIYAVGRADQRISHDYSDQSIQEDCKMMAFFDTLIQGELENWKTTPRNSDCDSDSDTDLEKVSLSPLKLHNGMFNQNGASVNRKQKLNPISQLVAQKRKRLAKMAVRMSSTYAHKNHKCKKLKKSKNLESSSKHHKSNGVTKKSGGKYGSLVDSVPHSNDESVKHKLRLLRSETRRRKNKLSSSSDSVYNIANCFMDAPSTSTGITSSSGSVFRVVEQDSDEEVSLNGGCLESRSNSEEESLVNILPTPLNGTHDLCLDSLFMPSSNSNGNVVAIRNEYTRNDHNNSVSDSSPVLCQNLNNYNDMDPCLYLFNEDSTDDSSDCDYTPPKKIRSNETTISHESSLKSGQCSSGSGYMLRNTKNHLARSSNSISANLNGHSSDDNDYQLEETFRRRSKKPRLNIRKRIGQDSDSN